MPRAEQKVIPIQSHQSKPLDNSDLPDLTEILADLKKILREDGLLPQHKH